MFTTPVLSAKKAILMASMAFLLVIGSFFIQTTQAETNATVLALEESCKKITDRAKRDVCQDIAQKIASLFEELLATTQVDTNDTQSDLCRYANGITHTLTEGDIDPQVITLQKFLNLSGYDVAKYGEPGSLGYEIDRFGGKTETAVGNWQVAHNIVTSKQAEEKRPENSGWGQVGELTRAAMKKGCGNTPVPVNGDDTATAGNERTATITSSPNAILNTEKTFTGTASNMTKVRLVLTQPSATPASIIVDVINGRWSQSIRGSRFAVSGNYTLTVQDSTGAELARQNILVGEDSINSGTELNDALTPVSTYTCSDGSTVALYGGETSSYIESQCPITTVSTPATTAGTPYIRMTYSPHSPVSPELPLCDVPLGESECTGTISWDAGNLRGDMTYSEYLLLTSDTEVDSDSRERTMRVNRSGSLDVTLSPEYYGKKFTLVVSRTDGTSSTHNILRARCERGTTWDEIEGECVLRTTQTQTAQGTEPQQETTITSTRYPLPEIPTFSFDRTSIPPTEYATLKYHFWAPDRTIESNMLCNVHVYDPSKNVTNAWNSTYGAVENSKVFTAKDYPRGATVDVVCTTRGGEVRKSATFVVADEPLDAYSYYVNNGGGGVSRVSRYVAEKMCTEGYADGFKTTPTYMVCYWGSEEIGRHGNVPSTFRAIPQVLSAIPSATITANGVAIANGGTITIPTDSKVVLGWNANVSGTSCTLNGLGGNVPSSGFININKANIGSYALSCAGMVPFTFNVKVNGTITANGVAIANGGTITIPATSKVKFGWNSNGGTSCALTGIAGNVPSADDPQNPIYIDATNVGTYVFICANMNPITFTVRTQSSGVSPSTTRVNATITADGVAIANGGTITIPAASKVRFRWNSNGGTSCTLSGLGGNVPSTDDPQNPTYIDKNNVGSYAFTCVGMNPFTFNVKVNGTITANGVAIANGGTITIPANSKLKFGWNSNGGTSCTLTGIAGNVPSADDPQNPIYIDAANVGTYVFSCVNMNPITFKVSAQTVSYARPTFYAENQGTRINFYWNAPGSTSCNWLNYGVIGGPVTVSPIPIERSGLSGTYSLTISCSYPGGVTRESTAVPLTF